MSQISMASVKPEEGKFVAPHAPRPVWDDKIRRQLAEIVGLEIYRWNAGSFATPEEHIEWIYKVLKYHPNDDGYRLARELEDECGISPDSELVDILDGVQYEMYTLIGNAVKEWVKKYELTLDFEVGQKVRAEVNILGQFEFEIVKLYPETMQYGLWNESTSFSKGAGHTIVDSEKVTLLPHSE